MVDYVWRPPAPGQASYTEMDALTPLEMTMPVRTSVLNVRDHIQRIFDDWFVNSNLFAK